MISPSARAREAYEAKFPKPTKRRNQIDTWGWERHKAGWLDGFLSSNAESSRVVEELTAALEPFAHEFNSGNEAFIEFVAKDEDNELTHDDFRRAAKAIASTRWGGANDAS